MKPTSLHSGKSRQWYVFPHKKTRPKGKCERKAAPQVGWVTSALLTAQGRGPRGRNVYSGDPGATGLRRDSTSEGTPDIAQPAPTHPTLTGGKAGAAFGPQDRRRQNTIEPQ